MNLIHENLFENTKNILFGVCSIKKEGFQNIKKIMGYPYIKYEKDKDYIYYREDDPSKIYLYNETYKRFIIDENLQFIEDDTIKLKMYNASHNLYIFDHNNISYGIGGQHETKKYIKLMICNKNYPDNFINFVNDDSNYIDNSDIIRKNIRPYVNPYVSCPFFSNGLYLFKFNNLNTSFTIENNNLPILSGVKPGRYDSMYCIYNNCDYSGKNIELSKGGISVYDTLTSIIFNTNNNKHYLFQRANLGECLRNIQYCTSEDLINWSDFKLLKTNLELNYANTNIYYPNFFKIKNVNGYIGLLQFTTPDAIYYETIGELQMYYSDDCENWNYIGNLGHFRFYEHWLIPGEPLFRNNKYYFFYYNLHKDTIENNGIEIYSLEKNRLSFMKSNDENNFSTALFKPIKLKNDILINFKTFNNGFIQIRLLDSNKVEIENYSYENFEIINENKNEYNYHISWKGIEYDYYKLFNNNVYIEIYGLNFEIFSIQY